MSIDPAAMYEGRLSSAAEGHCSSGTVPFGYRRPPRAKAGDHAPIAEPHPEEAALVKRIFRLYLQQRSMAKVQRILNAEGLRPRRAPQWNRPGLAWLLSNRFYIGFVTFGTVRSYGKHKPIVAPIVFWKVQKLIRKNDKRGRRRLAIGDVA